MRDISLKIIESLQKDVGRGRIRINEINMRKLGISPGDIVSLVFNTKKTGVIAWLPDKNDTLDDVIRIDGITRRNVGVKLGDTIQITTCQPSIAESVKIIPNENIVMDVTLKQYVKQKLLGYPVTNGDLVVIQLLGHANKFIVDNIIPETNNITIITDTTKLNFLEKGNFQLDDIQINYEDIGGLRPTIQKIREMVELPLRHPELFKILGISPPKGLLLYGPPGTGKTLIAKAVANESEANFVSIQAPEIMSKFYGESEAKLREIFKKAEENAPSIIFIDEIDAISSKRDDTTGEVERRVVAQILSLMDGIGSKSDVIVIGATNRPNSLDPALRRPGRFDRELLVNVPDQSERLEILQIHTRRMPGIEDINLESISKLTHGFVGADLAALAREAAMNTIRELIPKFDLDKTILPQNLIEQLKVKEHHFLNALKEIQPSAIREVYIEVPNVHFEDVGGLLEIKNELIEIIDWPLNHKDDLIRLGVKPPKGILLYGPSGSGKTLLVNAVANHSHINLISVKGPELLSKWVGESEKALREIFKKAKLLSPTIIFFDEIDAFTGSRGSQDSNSSSTSKSIMSQLLTELDGLEYLQNVIVIAATSRPDLLDSAIIRPGRIEKLLYVNPPNEKDRKEIFTIHTKSMPINKDINLETLAEQTNNFTGADISSICREAAWLALRDDKGTKYISKIYFDQALNKVGPSMTKELSEFYENFEKNHKNRTLSKTLGGRDKSYDFT
jgi:transitional endoplasmic reticulum ATPase